MLRRYLKARIVVGVALLVGVVLSWWLLRAPAPPEETDATDAGRRRAIALLLSREDGLPWTVHDLLLDDEGPSWPLGWQAALLTASAGSGDQEGGDLYRAELRTDSEGRILDLRSLANLTRTASSKERLVAAAWPYSVWSARYGGVVQSLVVVDARQDERELEPEAGWLQRALIAVNNRRDTGQWDGVGLSTFNLLIPALRVSGEASPGVGQVPRFELQLGRGEDSANARVLLAPESAEVLAGAEELIHRPRVWAGTPLIHQLVDTVRSFSWVGPRPIALLEKWVFSAHNTARSIAFRLGLIQEQNLAEELGVTKAQLRGGALQVAAADEDADWPPPPIEPLMRRPQPGEGQWFPFTTDWLKTLPGAPPAFYKTALRVPGDAPIVLVLVAMDLRQLDLRMAAGLSTPWSSTGNQGEGRIPREPERLRRTVAAFNGGFQTAHGAFGMLEEGKLILEPWQHKATTAVMKDGQVRMGTWNNTIEVPDDILSFRQNMPPFFEDGKWDPLRRGWWGGTVSDLDQVNTTRSALCYRGEHQLVYAWSKSIAAKTLAKTLMHAGCEYGMHLDMNPVHAGFGLLDIDPESMDDKGKIGSFRAEPPNRDQTFRLSRFVQRNGKDFFYLLLRKTLADRLPPPPEGFGPWEGQVAPRAPQGFLPVTAVSRSAASDEVLVALDAAASEARFVLGMGEARLLPPGSPALSQDDLTLSAPAAILDLGNVDPERPVGLIAGGRVLSPTAPIHATIGVAEGRLRLHAPCAEGDAAPEDPAQRQLCPLLVEGQLSGRAKALLMARRAKRHHALATLPDGTLIYLSSTAQAAPLAERLASLGAKDAVLLPDGDAGRLLLLTRSESGLVRHDPVSGGSAALKDELAGTTRVYFDRKPRTRRIDRLHLPEVELSEAELRRQRRIQARISEKRQALREISNAAYRRHVEKLKRKRAEEAAGKGEDG